MFDAPTNLPTLSIDQMIQVDRLMIEIYGITLIQMMENAGHRLATLARRRFLHNMNDQSVIVLAGAGGNGGGALVCARHLSNWGISVRVFLTKTPDLYQGVPAHQLSILQQIHVSIQEGGDFAEYGSADLIIDGIIGYSLKGTPKGTVKTMITRANQSHIPILALDVPSGMDAGSGESYSPTIQAEATLTLALPKTGLIKPESSIYTGELYLADISVPPELYQKLGISMAPWFKTDVILRIR